MMATIPDGYNEPVDSTNGVETIINIIDENFKILTKNNGYSLSPIIIKPTKIITLEKDVIWTIL